LCCVLLNDALCRPFFTGSFYFCSSGLWYPVTCVPLWILFRCFQVVSLLLAGFPFFFFYVNPPPGFFRALFSPLPFLPKVFFPGVTHPVKTPPFQVLFTVGSFFSSVRYHQQPVSAHPFVGFVFQALFPLDPARTTFPCRPLSLFSCD